MLHPERGALRAPEPERSTSARGNVKDLLLAPAVTEASDLPSLRLERSALVDFESALGFEWLVTNGLGGQASRTVLGVDTRRYHGLLVAALWPPV